MRRLEEGWTQGDICKLKTHFHCMSWCNDQYLHHRKNNLFPAHYLRTIPGRLAGPHRRRMWMLRMQKDWCKVSRSRCVLHQPTEPISQQSSVTSTSLLKLKTELASWYRIAITFCHLNCSAHSSVVLLLGVLGMGVVAVLVDEHPGVMGLQLQHEGLDKNLERAWSVSH